MWDWIVGFLRDIYMTFGDHIRDFADDGNWAAFQAFLPLGVAFGSVHAITPGHSKALLATLSCRFFGRRLAGTAYLNVTFADARLHVDRDSAPVTSPGEPHVWRKWSRLVAGP